jgi:hypothetical protein
LAQREVPRAIRRPEAALEQTAAFNRLVAKALLKSRTAIGGLKWNDESFYERLEKRVSV